MCFMYTYGTFDRGTFLHSWQLTWSTSRSTTRGRILKYYGNVAESEADDSEASDSEANDSAVGDSEDEEEVQHV